MEHSASRGTRVRPLGADGGLACWGDRDVIVGAAVCPGAPFLIPGVAEPLARESAALITACLAAVRPLAGADRIVLIAAGRRSIVYPAGRVTSQVAAPPVGRSDLVARECRPVLSVGTVVGQALVARAFPEGVPVPVDLVETGGEADTDDAAARHDARQRDSVLVIADGAATHGDHAPGRRDDRAGSFDDALAAALADGNPSALARACADPSVGRALLAVVEPLRVLARLTQGDPPTAADLLYRGSPYGVGYAVASWRWAGR